MNAVRQRETLLKRRNYVRKADPKANYWFDFAYSQLEGLRVTNGDDFFLIVHGDPTAEDDFFIIPYRDLYFILTEETLSEGKKPDNRKRWIGSIKENRLEGVTNFSLDLFVL